MVGIQGLGGVPEPKSGRPATVREERETRSTEGAVSSSASAPAQDGVLISSEAKAALDVARIIKSAESQQSQRTEKVEAARERLARGDYKRPEVVAKVAERLMKYLG